MLDALTGKRLFFWRRQFLNRFCRLVLPGKAQGWPDPADIGTVESVERYVAGLHFGLRLGMMALFDILNLLAVFTGYFRPMSWLPNEAAHRYLQRLEKSRVYVIRNLFTAAKALVMLVYYADTEIERKTGYADDCLQMSRPKEPAV
jgi:hypothetical protein